MTIDFGKINEETEKEPTILETALAYRSMGFSILPVQQNKRPYIKWEPYQKEKPTIEQIKAWWKRWPQANVALITGAISNNLVVADADSAIGLDKLNELIPEGLQFPMAATPGNGYHLYFYSENGLGNAARFIKDCDFRAEGGYVVAPPSRGLNGKSYYWVPGHELLNDIVPPALPKAIEKALSTIEAPTESKKPPEWHNELAKGVNEGNRHGAMSQLIGRYIIKGLTDEEILPLVESIDAKNNPPLAQEESLLKFIQGVRRTHERKERPEPKGGPSMADLRLYMDMDIRPGQSFTSRNVCDGLGAYQREHKKIVYAYLSRLAQEGTLKKDKYIHGGFRKPLEIPGYDLGSAIQANELFGVNLPLDLHNLLKIEPNQLVAISGRYDAGKSAFVWHTIALNYEQHKIVHFSSPEWDADAIKVRMDELGIPRPHPNIRCYPMEQGYEDLIPNEQCIVLVDYIRAATGDFADIDRQFHRIFENLHGGVCFTAIQKHPGLDRPVGGQFAIHAPHHVILLDKIKRGYVCKVFKSKSEKDLEGLFRIFTFTDGRQLVPRMDNWKKGEIKWEEPKEVPNDNNDNDDNNDNEK